MKKLFITVLTFLGFALSIQAQGVTPLVPTILVGSGGSFSNTTDSVEVFGYNEISNAVTKYLGISDNAITGLVGNSRGRILVSTTSTLSLYQVINNEATLLSRVNTLGGIRNPIFVNDSVCAGLFGFGVAQGAQTVRFYSLPNLTEIQVGNRITEQTGSAILANNRLFVTVPGSFPSTEGKLLVVNLNAATYPVDTIINFGAPLRNLDKIIAQADSIYLPTSLSFGSTTGNLGIVNVSNLNSRVLTFTHPVALLASVTITPATNSTLLLGKFNAGNQIDQFILGSGGSPNPLPNWNQPYINMFFNENSNNLYLSNTDYATFGKVYRYSSSLLSITDSFTVGVSPEYITSFQYPIASNTEKLVQQLKISAYPQPAANVLFLQGADLNDRTLILSNAIGQVFSLPIHNNQVEVNNLNNGLYVAKIQGINTVPFKLIIRK